MKTSIVNQKNNIFFAIVNTLFFCAITFSQIDICANALNNLSKNFNDGNKDASKRLFVFEAKATFNSRWFLLLS